LRPGNPWLGRRCANWRPTTARTLADLAALQWAIYRGEL
jgi:hypothetical protein